MVLVMTAQVGPPELLFHLLQVKPLLLLLLPFVAKVMMAMLLVLMMTEHGPPDFPHQLLQARPPLLSLHFRPLRPLRTPHPLLPADHRAPL